MAYNMRDRRPKSPAYTQYGKLYDRQGIQIVGNPVQNVPVMPERDENEYMGAPAYEFVGGPRGAARGRPPGKRRGYQPKRGAAGRAAYRKHAEAAAGRKAGPPELAAAYGEPIVGPIMRTPNPHGPQAGQQLEFPEQRSPQQRGNREANPAYDAGMPDPVVQAHNYPRAGNPNLSTDNIAGPPDSPNPQYQHPNANPNAYPDPNPDYNPDLDPDEPDLSADDNAQPLVAQNTGLLAGQRDAGDKIPRTPMPVMQKARANAPANMTYIRENSPILMQREDEEIAHLPLHNADDIANVAPPAAQTSHAFSPIASPKQPMHKPPSSETSFEKGDKLTASASVSLSNSDVTRNESTNLAVPATTGHPGPSGAQSTTVRDGQTATNASMGIAGAKETLGKFPVDSGIVPKPMGKFPADSGIVPISMGKSPADSGFVPISKPRTVPIPNSDFDTNTMVHTVRRDGRNAPIDLATVVPDLIKQSQAAAEALAHDLDKLDLAPTRPQITATNTTLTDATTTNPTDATITDPRVPNTWSEHYRQVLPNPMGQSNSICSATVGDSLPPAHINARPMPSNVSNAPAVSCAKSMSSKVVKQSQYEQMTSTYAHFPSEQLPGSQVRPPKTSTLEPPRNPMATTTIRPLMNVPNLMGTSMPEQCVLGIHDNS